MIIWIIIHEIEYLLVEKKKSNEKELNKIIVPEIRQYLLDSMESYREVADNAPEGSMPLTELNNLALKFILRNNLWFIHIFYF